jgi:ribose transport system substrate-binding protein
MKKSLAVVLLCAMLAGFQVFPSAAQTQVKIAVIPKGTTHVFWKSVEAGARAAGKDFGVEVIWKGPLKENDRAQQISIVEQFVTEGVSGIVLAPLDDRALLRPVSAAAQKKIPVVIFDSGLQGEAGKDFTSFVATDNKAGGRLAGEQMKKLLGGKGKIVLLRYLVGSASTTEREEGFLEAIRQNKEMQMLVENRYAGATPGDAKTASMNLVDKLAQANGIFCPNESSTFGMLLALRQSNLAGKVKFIGFDTSRPLIEALQQGEIDALVAQDPVRIGYEGVRVMVEHLKGKAVPSYVDTGVRLVTRSNLNTAEIQKLLETP